MLQIEYLCSKRLQILESYLTLETAFRNIAIRPTTGLLPVFIFHPEKVQHFLCLKTWTENGALAAQAEAQPGSLALFSFLHEVFLQVGTAHGDRDSVTLLSRLL